MAGGRSEPDPRGIRADRGRRRAARARRRGGSAADAGGAARRRAAQAGGRSLREADRRPQERALRARARAEEGIGSGHDDSIQDDEKSAHESRSACRRSADSPVAAPRKIRRITITRPDDWHLHLRDGEHMRAVLPDTARRFARAIVMPNLRPPVTTTQARARAIASASWRRCPPAPRSSR